MTAVQEPLFAPAPLADRVAAAHRVLDDAEAAIRAEGKTAAATVILFSGGDDSTILADMFRARATHIAHCNTGIGIEETRQFVRDMATGWALPLLEKHPPEGQGYRDLVLGRVLSTRGPNKGKPVYAGGFPGPEMHWLMYQRLKERSLERIRNELVSNPREYRVIFLAGRRGTESQRRSNRVKRGEMKAVERRGSVVWVSPLLNWSALDMNDYRRAHPHLPRNEVAALLHMSGECLCGAYAKPGELDEIGDWFPGAAAGIRNLEAEALAAGLPPKLCRWGFGGSGSWRPSRTGPLCSSCDARFQQLELEDDDAEAS